MSRARLLQLLRQRFGLVATRLSSRAWRGRMRSRRDSRHASSCGPCFWRHTDRRYTAGAPGWRPNECDILADAVRWLVPS